MQSFEVHGPFDVPFEIKKGGRALIFKTFWDDDSKSHMLAGERGCYVFAIRTGRGLVPIYVGKATKTFKQETFNPSNRNKFTSGFSDYAKGRPQMYFVTHPKQKGRVNAKQIAEVEDFLIQAGVAKNPSLQNLRGRQQPNWSIKGVIRSGVGKRSRTEVEFRSLFDIN